MMASSSQAPAPTNQIIRSHFVAADSHMHEVHLDGNGWHDEDLTAQYGGPLVQDGSIALIYDPVNHAIRNHYVGLNDRHVHELYSVAIGWHDADLTAIVGGPDAHWGPIATILDPL